MKRQRLTTALLLGLLCYALPTRAQPDSVWTGMHLMNIYNIDINEHTFYADFYVWFKWKNAELDPTKIEFVNAVEKWGFTNNLIYEEEPLRLPDSTLYNAVRIEGRFYHPFDLLRFPLDEHRLDIYMEHISLTKEALVFVPDTQAASVREQLHIPGWDIKGVSSKIQSNRYATNFGETGKLRPEFSDFAFDLHIARPVNYFLLKLFLPLLIVILISLGSLLVEPLNIDARVSLAIGGLLSAVFLQQSYSDALPDVGYMVLMDKIYLLVYAMITAILLRVVLVGNRIAKHPETDLKAVHKSDLRRFFWFLVILLGGIGLLL